MTEREIGILIGLALGFILSGLGAYVAGFTRAWREDRRQRGR